MSVNPNEPQGSSGDSSSDRPAGYPKINSGKGALVVAYSIAFLLVGGMAFSLGLLSSHRSVAKSAILVSISPSTGLILGEDLTINYQFQRSVPLGNVQVRITNENGELVFSETGLSGISGNQTVVWPKGKWNQGPYIGSLANPANGPYSIQVTAAAEAASSAASQIQINVVTVNTLLVLQGDLDKSKPSPDEISSGLYRPALDPTSPEHLQVGLIPKGAEKSAIVYALALPQFSEIVEEDLNNNLADGLEVKSAHVRQEMQSTFPNGDYVVVMSGLRDLAGNRGTAESRDGIMEGWVISLR